MKGSVGAEFYRRIDIESCLKIGLSIEASTIRWWMTSTSGKARQDAFGSNGVYIGEVLIDLSGFYNDTGAEYTWCHGATFDVPILNVAYAKLERKPPWSYRNVFDTRTLYCLAGFKPNSETVEHSALADAFQQAKDVSAAYRKMFGIPASEISGGCSTSINTP